MKVRLWCVGKTGARYLKEGVQDYQKRLTHYLPFEYHELPGIKKASRLSTPQLVQQEGEQIMKRLTSQDFLVLLDERGKSYSSIQLADQLDRWLQNPGIHRLIFLIGGAHGFSPELYDRAQQQWSLSPLTFSHQMIRLFALEQLYRAMTILRNEPYHNEG